MANPGYPQMGHTPGNPMMGHQMPAPGMRGPMRRGTSKAVPVVVSAGLAVGVFCGLLFGVGTGKDEAAAATSSVSDKNDKKDDKKPDKPASTSTKPAVATTAAPSTETKPAAGSAAIATTAAGSASGTKPPASATQKMAKLTVHIKPEAAASAAKIVVDGKEIAGSSVDIPVDSGGKKSVKVAITAPGYHSIDQKVDLEGDETKLDLEMAKRAGGGQAATPATGGTTPKTGGTTPHPPGGGKKPPKKPGGLIDI